MHKKPIKGYVTLHNKMTEKGLTMYFLAQKIHVSNYKLRLMFDGKEMALTPIQIENIKNFINDK